MSKMREWSSYSTWNFENKLLLLEAEWHNASGDYDIAALSYETSVSSASEHKFINEEALASKLAGTFFLERGHRTKSRKYFERSVACFRIWGAHAVAKQVEETIKEKFGSDLVQACVVDAKVEKIAAEPKSQKPQSKKHQME